jgi:hypothetical protein
MFNPDVLRKWIESQEFKPSTRVTCVSAVRSIANPDDSAALKELFYEYRMATSSDEEKKRKIAAKEEKLKRFDSVTMVELCGTVVMNAQTMRQFYAERIAGKKLRTRPKHEKFNGMQKWGLDEVYRTEIMMWLASRIVLVKRTIHRLTSVRYKSKLRTISRSIFRRTKHTFSPLSRSCR